VGWSIADYQVLYANSPFAGAGLGLEQATLQWQAVSAGQLWRIERITAQVAYVQNVVPVGVLVFDQDPGNNVAPADETILLPEQGVGGAGAAPAAYDISDDAAPITVTEGNRLTVVFSWLGDLSPAGAVALGRIQVAIMSGTAGAPSPVAGSVPGPTIPASM
jgi:hypothetical protein